LLANSVGALSVWRSFIGTDMAKKPEPKPKDTKQEKPKANDKKKSGKK
jgi:hypothetical protein